MGHMTYVLISVGPQGTTRGLVTNVFPDSYFDDLQSVDYMYHAMGIFAYFMASRDADDNGELDFEYRARTSQGEAKNPNNWLPGDARTDAGPLIFVAR